MRPERKCRHGLGVWSAGLARVSRWTRGLQPPIQSQHTLATSSFFRILLQQVWGPVDWGGTVDREGLVDWESLGLQPPNSRNTILQQIGEPVDLGEQLTGRDQLTVRRKVCNLPSNSRNTLLQQVQPSKSWITLFQQDFTHLGNHESAKVSSHKVAPHVH